MLRSNTESIGLIRKRHGIIQNDTCQGVCIVDEQRFATVQVRASTNKNDLQRVSTNRHGATWTCHDNQSIPYGTISAVIGFGYRAKNSGELSTVS